MPEKDYEKFEKYKEKYMLIHVKGIVKSLEHEDLYVSDAVIDVDSPAGLEQVLVNLKEFQMRVYPLTSEDKKKYQKEDALTKGDAVELLIKEGYLRADENGNIQRPYSAFAIALATEKMRNDEKCYIANNRKKKFHYNPLRKRRKSKEETEQEQKESAQSLKLIEDIS